MRNIIMALATTVLASTALIVPSGAQESGQNTANLTIRATFKAGCTIDFGNGGTYDLGTFSNLNRAFPENGMTGRFTFSCTNGNQVAKKGVSLDFAGNRGEKGGNNRYLYTNAVNVPNQIPLNVYIGNTASGQIWGDGTDGTSIINLNNDMNGQYEFTMQIPSSPNLTPEFKGDYAGYSNTFVATVVYDGVPEN